MNPGVPELSLLAINLTQRCNLACAHCYLDAGTRHRGDPHELDTAEVKALLDDIATLGQGTLVVLTGGEPLLRRDLESLIAHGRARALPMVVGTNGMLLTERRVRSLAAAGLLGLGISIDSLDPALHDRFRGRPGAWTRTMTGIERCRDHGLDFQLHFTVTDDNAGELAAVAEFARSVGARALNVFFLVCVGRGASLEYLAPQRYEQTLGELLDMQSQFPELMIRPRCAPHFKRIAHQRHPEAPLNRISGRDGDGCIAGIHYARVDSRGAVTACPYIEQSVGNLRGERFSALWADAEMFQSLRQPRLGGKCGACEYRRLCGGCRARPLAAGGNLLDADTLCTYVPPGEAVIEPTGSATNGNRPIWSAAATRRLERVPDFLRALVRKRAEAYVCGLGETSVTERHLTDMVAARFGAAAPRRAPPQRP